MTQSREIAWCLPLQMRCQLDCKCVDDLLFEECISGGWRGYRQKHQGHPCRWRSVNQSSHEPLLDGECSIARAYGKEVVGAGQEGLSLLWWAITDGHHDKVDADEHDRAQ